LVLLGILLFLVRRQRVLPTKLRAVVMGLLAGLIGWYCLLPLGCTTSSVPRGPDLSDVTTCTTLFNLPSPNALWAIVVGCLIDQLSEIIESHSGGRSYHSLVGSKSLPRVGGPGQRPKEPVDVYARPTGRPVVHDLTI
jgi:hypothetical protein